MAYAAFVSLHTTIRRILNSSRISIVSPNSRPNFENLLKEIVSSVRFLTENSSLEIVSSRSKNEERMIAEMDRRIMEALHELEDALESCISTQIHLQCDDHAESYPLQIDIDLQQLDPDIDSFNEKLNNIKEDCRVQILELNGEDNDDHVLTNIDFKSLVLAYDALICLMRSMNSRIWFTPESDSCSEIELVYTDLDSLKILSERISIFGNNIHKRTQKVIDKLHNEIKDTAYELASLLQPNYFVMPWDKDIIKFFAPIIRKIKMEYRTQVLGLSKTSIEDGCGDDNNNSSRIDFGSRSKKVAYAALISLMMEIEDLYYSESLNVVMPPCPKIESVYKDLGSLQLILEKRSNTMSQDLIVNLDREIREATCKLKNALVVFHELLHQTTSPLTVEYDQESFDLNIRDFQTELRKLDQEIDFFTSSMIKIKEEYTSSIEPPSKIVGLDDKIEWFKDQLINYGEDDANHLASVYGMVGSGKTTLVRHVYEDPLILCHFQRRAWVTIGPNYKFEKVMSDLLDQLSPTTEDNEISGTWILQGKSSHLYKILRSKKYLIVFDDIWDTEFLETFKRFFPDDENRSRVVITTRLEKVTIGPLMFSHGYTHKMWFLNKKDSWDLFCEKVFGGNLSCPDELKKVAKKIVENCEGLPLAIIVIGKHLSKSEETLEYWTNVAEKRIPIFNSADDSYEVIFSSYKYLPLHLKACFLYTGIFPQDSMIDSLKLSQLASVEGLCQPNPNNLPETTAYQCFKDLVSNSVIISREQSSSITVSGTCGVHYVFQHMIQCEASKTKLFHIINGYDENSLTAETLKSHRRICIHNNVLFGVNKDVQKSMVSISTTMRSLLCTGEHHKYPVQILYSELSLLRVLEALTIRFYQFPFEILKLVRLRYLAFTYNGELPSSISRFWDLQYLIVHQHVMVHKSSTGAPKYLPVEIWNMKELRHLEVVGRELPDPPTGGSLPNLIKLEGVSFRSCTDKVLRGISNLKQLGIRIELDVDDVNAEPLLYWCNNLRPLHQLQRLECTIVNPNHTSRVVAPLPPFPVLPSSVNLLVLDGFGYAWEHLSQIIDGLSCLEYLYLLNYAFRGPKLELTSKFNKLKFLHISDTDLEYLGGCGPSLVYLILWHCYKLKEIPNYFDSLQKILLVDCNPSTAESAKKTKNAKGDVSSNVRYSFE